MTAIPLWIRKFIFDFVTTLVPSLIVFNFVQPTDALSPALLTAVASAAASAALRNVNGMKLWLGEVLGVEDDG